MPIKGSSKPVSQRIGSKFIVNETSQCWQWIGALCGQSHTPIISLPGSKQPVTAYKFFWEQKNGEFPTGLAIDNSFRYELHHTCLNHQCINPDHIELVTNKEHHAIHSELRRERAEANLPWVRAMAFEGRSTQDIKKVTGVSVKVIRKIEAQVARKLAKAA